MQQSNDRPGTARPLREGVRLIGREICLLRSTEPAPGEEYRQNVKAVQDRPSDRIRCNGDHQPSIKALNMEWRLKTGVALIAALALACVLISPMPDELPGTALKLGILSFVVPAGPGFDLWGVQSTTMAILPEAGLRLTLDVLAVTCVRLC